MYAGEYQPDELDDDQKNAIVTEFVVAFRNRGDEGVGFNVAMGDDTMCVVGLLETIKTFLLLAQIEGV